MGHELHGDWHLYVVKAINSAGDLGLFPDGTIRIEMPNAASNVMQSGSKHGTNDLVRGSATAINGVYSVKFEEQLTTGASPTFRPYAGFLIDRRDTPSGDRVLMMAGFRRPITTGPGITSSNRSKTRKAAVAPLLVGQEEGTWVATKP
jgi:hypothetical protein